MRFLALGRPVRLTRSGGGRGRPGAGVPAWRRRARVAGVDRRPDASGGGQYLQEAGAAVMESGAARRQQRRPAGR